MALTFSGGPSAVWTPRILDMLGRLGAPATFFVVGESAAQHPDLVRREVAEGYTVGNQTFSHADLSTAAAWRGRVELIAADRVITGITGRRPLLFSPPAAAAPGPEGSIGPCSWPRAWATSRSCRRSTPGTSAAPGSSASCATRSPTSGRAGSSA